jgi:hypothetical protein
VPGKLDSRNLNQKSVTAPLYQMSDLHPRLAECVFLAARGNLSLDLTVLDFEITHLDRTGCTRTPIKASVMIFLISVEEIRDRDRSDLLSSI